MRGTGIRTLLLLGCFLLWLGQIGWAAERKPLFFSDEEAAVASASVEDGEIYLPALLLQQAVYQHTKIDLPERQFLLRPVLPRFALPQHALNALLREGASQFALPLRMIDGAAYVEADAAAKLLGFVWKETADGITLRRNAYGSFAPRVLPRIKPRKLGDGEKLSLVWQPVLKPETDLSRLEKHAGLDVVSPSWLEIAGADGSLINRIDGAYVRRAQKKGYRVWALITNRFDPALTSRVLQSEKARRNVVRQLATYVSLYGLDGINLDFENVYDADRDRLSAFVGEISDALRQLGATVSIDVTAPSNISQWSVCYDRAALGAAVDYVVLMAYDEHWRTSPVSGSVASIGWVERGLRNTLREVPPEKLILGVPLYMRAWEEEAGRTTGVKTMTMEAAAAMIAQRKLTPEWLEEQGQYYFSYEEGGKTYRVWQEEARSLALKLSLVERYDLAGAAAWRKGFESADIWEVMRAQLKGAASEDHKKDLKEKDRKKKKSRRRS